MTEPLNVEQAAARLRAAGSILILCHKNPDGDTVGCGSALYHALTRSPAAWLIPGRGCSGASLNRNWWWRWMWPGCSFLGTKG